MPSFVFSKDLMFFLKALCLEHENLFQGDQYLEDDDVYVVAQKCNKSLKIKYFVQKLYTFSVLLICCHGKQNQKF